MAKGEYLSRITPIFLKLSRITEKWNKILTTLTSILLSFDLRKPEVEKREKRVRSWCHTYLFSVSLLLVLNDVNHHGNFKGKPRVTRCENSKSRITLLGQITSHAAIWAQSIPAENLGPFTRHGKPIPPCEIRMEKWPRVLFVLSAVFFFPCCRRCRWNKIPAPAGRIEPSVTILNAREKRILLWLDPGDYLV